MNGDQEGGVFLKYKSIVTEFLIVSILMSVSGCRAVENVEYEVNPDPTPVNVMETVSLNFEMETDYNNISVKTELLTYPKDTEKIVYTITNHNEGKGFYYFSIPYIEYYDQEKWTRLAYYPPNYGEESGRWNICGIEGNREMTYSCNGVFYPQSISEGIKIENEK